MIKKELLLTDRAVKFLTTSATPVCASDFVGYLFRVYLKKDIFGKVTNDGVISFYRGDKKPVSKREHDKHLKQLLNTGFLTYDVEVFPEFSNKKNLPMNPKKTLFMEEPLFVKEC